MSEATIGISVCVPVSISDISQIEFFNELLCSFENQQYPHKDILISDDSQNDMIRDLCLASEKRGYRIRYIRNNKNGMARNLNHAIESSSGAIIKIMFQDDFFYSENALSEIEDQLLHSEKSWYLSSCNHFSQEKQIFYETFHPKKSKKLSDGVNTISSPSVVAFKRWAYEPFSEKLTYLVDCEWYLRMSHKHGLPIFGKPVQITNRVHKNQATHWAKDFKLSEIQMTKMMHSDPNMGLRVCSCL